VNENLRFFCAYQNKLLLFQEVLKNDTSVVTKPELQQSVITTVASNNKILVNSFNKLKDKGKLFSIVIIYLRIVFVAVLCQN